MITVSVSLPTLCGAVLIAPVGLAIPHVAPVAVTVDGADHLKLGLDPIRPALNPKPGMGLHFATLGLHDITFVGEPVWLWTEGKWDRGVICQSARRVMIVLIRL